MRLFFYLKVLTAVSTLALQEITTIIWGRQVVGIDSTLATTTWMDAPWGTLLESTLRDRLTIHLNMTPQIIHLLERQALLKNYWYVSHANPSCYMHLICSVLHIHNMLFLHTMEQRWYLLLCVKGLCSGVI